MEKKNHNFNRNKVRGKIIEVFGSYQAFASAIGTDNTTVSRKLSGAIAITSDDVIDWSEALGLMPEEIGPVFFALNV